MERETANSTSKGNEWKEILIRGSKYLISTSAARNSWKISLSDLVEIWTETITRETALERCQSLNMLLDLETFDVKGTLDKILNDVPKYATEIRLDEIKLENRIDGIGFKFIIKLTKGNERQFFNQITKPLCRSSIELRRRNDILLDLIKKKDNEITEYKLGGGQLISKNVETLPYDENIFGDGITTDNQRSESLWLNNFQSVMQFHNQLKIFHSELNGDSRSPNSPELPIKTEIEDPEIAESTARFIVSGGEPSSGIAKTAVSSSVVKSEAESERIKNDEKSKTNFETKKKSNKLCLGKIVANIPSASAEQPRNKKSKRKLNINDLIS